MFIKKPTHFLYFMKTRKQKKIIKKTGPQKLKRAPIGILPHVVFLRTKSFENIDVRRIISGVAGDFGIPLQIRQIKIIEFSEESVRNRLVVGNHRHFGESGQWEFIIILGVERRPVFRFRYRNFRAGVKEKLLRGGDVVLVPPGCSLALVALRPGAKLIEISNQEFKNMNYIDDKLF